FTTLSHQLLHLIRLLTSRSRRLCFDVLPACAPSAAGRKGGPSRLQKLSLTTARACLDRLLAACIWGGRFATGWPLHGTPGAHCEMRVRDGVQAPQMALAWQLFI